MAEQNKFFVYSKDWFGIFNIIEIIAGIPFAYGWKIEGFDVELRNYYEKIICFTHIIYGYYRLCRT